MRQSVHPLCWVAGCWLVGVLTAQSFGIAGGWRSGLALSVFAAAALVGLWGASAAGAGVGAARTGSNAREKPVLICLALLAWAAGLAMPARPGAAGAVPPAGMARLVAVVEQSNALPDEGSSAVLRVVRGQRLTDGAQFASGTYLSAGPAPLPVGATIKLLAKVTPRAPFRNLTPHPLPPPRFELRGRASVPSGDAVRVLDRSLWRAALEGVREHVRARLGQTLPPRAAAVAQALVLGDDRVLDASDAADVRGAGLLHVFAVSGLHVAILAGLLVAWLEAALRCTWLVARWEVRRVACGLGIPLVLAYGVLAGGAPSAWRASATAAVAWGLVACGRRPDAVAVTSAALLLLGAFEPSLVVRPAFLLSIVATGAILGAQLGAAGSVRGWLREAVLLSARTLLATAPISLWFFGGVQLCGLLANIVLAPFGSLLLVQASALHALVCTLTPWGAWSAAPFVVLSEAFIEACGVLGRIGPSVTWPVPDVAQGLVLVAFAALMLLSRGWRARGAWALSAVVLLGALELGLRRRERPRGALRVSFLDVGQGDAALVDLPDGRLMLIDGGGSPGGGLDPGRAVLLPLLQARRRDRIDVVVLTHPHPDHYGGLNAVLDAIEVGELWDSGQADAEADLASTSAEAAHLLELARARGTRVRGPGELCGTPHAFGTARVRLIAPCPSHDRGFDPNDNSLVLRIEYGQRALLFAGDAEAHEEAVLLEQREALRADVLKVGHHGSLTSTGREFLHAVGPQLGVISCGVANRFGHPHPEVMARLRAEVPQLVRLDQDGGAELTTDGHEMEVRTWSGRRLRVSPRLPAL